jgi:C1A family cysteine protease
MLNLESTEFSEEIYQSLGTGWVKDSPDPRDYNYVYGTPDPKANVDLRKWFPPPYNQGRTNTCVAQSLAGAIEYFMLRGMVNTHFTPSRLFIYWVGRQESGISTSKDIGMTIRGGMKGVVKRGVPKEERWPWDESNVNVEPPITAYSNAAATLIARYERLPVSVEAIKHALQREIPVIAGFKVYSSYYSYYTYTKGFIPLPKEGERWRGGHAVVIVGYSDDLGHFIFRNSYGPRWGDKGYGYLPYDYVDRKFMGDSDLWAITKVYRYMP